MTDAELLRKLRTRLVDIYGENPRTDFIIRLDAMIKKMTPKARHRHRQLKRGSNPHGLDATEAC